MRYKDDRHYLDRDDDHEWTGHGTDDGYDAIKDANAEAGLPHDSPHGFGQAIKNGWLRKVPKDSQ
ncbi:MAG: hypothetical protein KUG81_07380 [Gammaproteobacteria bacterium]|nr:hypothetical protein [Gammaproteobacteria bacterium]